MDRFTYHRTNTLTQAKKQNVVNILKASSLPYTPLDHTPPPDLHAHSCIPDVSVYPGTQEPGFLSGTVLKCGPTPGWGRAF